MLLETKYRIVVNMYVQNGYVETGRFFIGTDKTAAIELFRQLEGDVVAADKALLRLDLIADEQQGLDMVLHTLGCTLHEMSENVKVILVETFRMLNLE